MWQVNKLFPIQQEYMQLMMQVEDAEGEITPEVEQALQFTEQRLQTEGAEVGYVIKSWQYMEETLESEIERLGKLKAKIGKSKELLKNRLSEAMQQFGVERITGQTITISFRRSEAVQIDSERALPGEYFDAPPIVPNKTRIKEAIKAGKDVPGASIVHRKNLQIK